MKVSLKLFHNEQKKLGGCGTPEWCSKCRLFEKVCPGSNGGCTTKQDVAQRECYSACNTCGGGPAKPHSAPAICCKSPLKTILLEQALGANREEGKEFFNITPRPKIVINHSGIIVTQGSPGAAFGSSDTPFPPEVRAVAVNLRHVWSKTAGWWSDDLRDYLRVSKDVKLLLLTSVFDNRLEDAWDAGLQDEDFSSVGFDYWQNLSFSIYAEDSPMQSYWSALRSLRSVQSNKSWFAEDVRAPRLLPAWTKQRLLEQVSKVPQLVLNFQFIRGDKAELLAHGADLKAYHDLLPANVAIWLLGPVQPAAIKFFKKVAPNRNLYFLSAMPWIGAHRGALLGADGKLAKSKINKKDLVWANQRAYLKITEG